MRVWPQPALRASSWSESLAVTMVLYVRLCLVTRPCLIYCYVVRPSGGHDERLGATDRWTSTHVHAYTHSLTCIRIDPPLSTHVACCRTCGVRPPPKTPT